MEEFYFFNICFTQAHFSRCRCSNGYFNLLFCLFMLKKKGKYLQSDDGSNVIRDYNV